MWCACGHRRRSTLPIRSLGIVGGFGRLRRRPSSAVSGEQLADGPTTAAAFIDLGLAQILTAALILLRPTRPVLRAATVLNISAVVAWTLTEAGVLDFLHATSHHGHIALPTATAETVVTLTSLRWLTHPR